MGNHYYQVKNFFPHLKNPQKYSAKDKTITLRSSWEIKFAKWCDMNPDIIEWNSESIIIPYLYPVDGRMHRYFTDFWIRVKQENGTKKEYIVEIKPFAETFEPKKPQRITKGYHNKVLTWIKNDAKWKATRAFCNEQKKRGRDIDFMIITEKELPV